MLLPVLGDLQALGLLAPLLLVVVRPTWKDGVDAPRRFPTPQRADPRCSCPARGLVGCDVELARQAMAALAEAANASGSPGGPSSRGLADSYLDDLEELRQQLTVKYGLPAYTQAGNLGHGLGGLLALHASSTRPRQWPYALADAPALWWNCGELVRGLPTSPAARSLATPKVYLDASGADGRQLAGLARAARDALEGAGFVEGRDVWLVLEQSGGAGPAARLRRCLHGLVALFGTAEARRLAYSGGAGVGGAGAGAAGARVPAQAQRLFAPWATAAGVTPAPPGLAGLAAAACAAAVAASLACAARRLRVAAAPSAWSHYEELQPQAPDTCGLAGRGAARGVC